MRKTLLIVAAALALTGAAVSPAVAAPAPMPAQVAEEGVAGPFGSADDCKLGQIKYINAGYKVGPCFKDISGFYFKYIR